MRDAWLDVMLSTAPADHAAAEEALVALYALAGRPMPPVVEVASPAAAIELLGPPASITITEPVPVEQLLATEVAGLRRRLDARADLTIVRPDPTSRRGITPSAVVGSAVRDPLRAVRDAVTGPVRASGRLGLFWSAHHEIDWIAHHDVRAQVLGVRHPPADAELLRWWTQLARAGGWWWPRDDLCVVAGRPSVLRTEAPAGGPPRLHAENGPALAFPDGWVVHAWHGTTVPAWVVEDPTPARIAAERNAEVRRCAIEHLGWDTFVDGAGLRLVGRAADPGNAGAELRLYDLPDRSWGRHTRLLLAVNGSPERDGTLRRYGLRVPSWFDDPVDAAGWSYGLTGTQYALLQRRT